MSSKESASVTPSPSPSVEAPPAEFNEQKKNGESSREKSESPEPGSKGDASETLESASSSSYPSPPEGGAAPEAPSSKDDNSGEPSSNDSADQSGTTLPAVTNAHVQGDWQAIWSAQHGMYYFHNIRTNETTWTNPLAPSDSTATASTSSSAYLNAQEAATAAGIDPDLAYLDTTLAAGPSTPAAFAYTAKFNSRTGAFAKADARNPEHVSEYERMKRMNSFYFDMDAWQQDVEKRQEEEEEEEAAGKKRKKPTKKDLEAFKERKKQKKLAKTAWLRT